MPISAWQQSKHVIEGYLCLMVSVAGPYDGSEALSFSAHQNVT
jgi:hypothetical protein